MEAGRREGRLRGTEGDISLCVCRGQGPQSLHGPSGATESVCVCDRESVCVCV